MNARRGILALVRLPKWQCRRCPAKIAWFNRRKYLAACCAQRIFSDALDELWASQGEQEFSL